MLILHHFIELHFLIRCGFILKYLVLQRSYNNFNKNQKYNLLSFCVSLSLIHWFIVSWIYNDLLDAVGCNCYCFLFICSFFVFFPITTKVCERKHCLKANKLKKHTPDAFWGLNATYNCKYCSLQFLCPPTIQHTA